MQSLITIGRYGTSYSILSTRTIQLSGLDTFTASDVLFIHNLTQDKLVFAVVEGKSSGVGVASGIITIPTGADDLATTDELHIQIAVDPISEDRSTNSKLVSLLNPDYEQSPGSAPVLSTPQNLTTSFANVGGVIPTTGYKKVFLKLSININNGTGIEAKGLGLSSSDDLNPGDLPIYNNDTATDGAYKAKTEANIFAFNDEYFDTAGTPTDRTIWIGFDVGNAVPFLQLQMKCGATGTTAPAIDEVILCKGY